MKEAHRQMLPNGDEVRKRITTTNCSLAVRQCAKRVSDAHCSYQIGVASKEAHYPMVPNKKAGS